MRTKSLLSIHPVAERGGSDFCLLRMVRSMAADGWQCHVVTPAPSPLADEFTAAGATLHVLPMRKITTTGGVGYWLGYAAMWPVTVFRLARLTRRLNVDVIHSNSLHSWYGWAVALLTRRPHVWHGREIVVQSRAALRLERFLTSHFATQVIVCSKPVGDQLPGARVRVIPDVVGPEDGLEPGRAGRFRPRVDIREEAPLIGAAGRLDTWKGFGVVLDSIPKIRGARPDAEVVIAGAAVPGKESYAELLRGRASASPAVHWLGPRTDMADLLADLDVLLLPSTEPEPFASVAVEALASGVPVVGSDSGGTPEMLRPFGSEGGRLVPPGDPDSLAAAVLEVLPGGPSSVERRRRRRPMVVRQTVSFATAFDEVRETARRRPDGDGEAG